MSKELFLTEMQAEIQDAILDAEFSEFGYYHQEEKQLVDEYEQRITEENLITKPKKNEK